MHVACVSHPSQAHKVRSPAHLFTVTLLPHIIHYKYKLQVINPRLDHYLLRVCTRTQASQDSQAKQPEHRACQGGIQRVNKANVEGSTGEGVIH
jgi:hypothetical protein